MEDNIISAEQPTQATTFFAFDSPKGQSSYIKVIGVGGGGGNAVNHMYNRGIEGVDFIVCNTDMKALNDSPVPNKIPLGDLGLGAGNKPERARIAAEAKADDIREAISHNTQMLFITAGMGGGTGTGAAPVIAEIAKKIELDNEENKRILVVAIVTRPFSFEGRRRREQAEAGIAELRKHVDSIIVINNDKLRSYGDLDISEAFGMANDVLLTAAKGIAEIITVTANVNIDFQDVNTVMENSGTALMGTGSGSGEARARQAIEEATTSVLLDDSDIRGAKNVLLYFSYSSEHKIKMDEIGEITDFISDKTDGTAEVIWGAGIDDTLGDSLKVTLIATGFEKSAQAPAKPVVHELPQDIVVAPEPAVAAPAVDDMVIIHKEEPAAPQQPRNVYEAPALNVATQVAAPAAPAPAGRVFVLEAEDDEVAVAEHHLVRPQAERSDDALVSDIHILDTFPSTSEETAAPAAAPVSQTIAQSAFVNDNDVRLTGDRAERIRRIHEMLRNNPQGADLVQAMTNETEQGAELYAGPHSSSRESSGFSMRQDGTMVKNGYFGEQPD